MDIEEPVVVLKKSPILAFIIIVWLIILTVAVAMFIMAPEKLETRLAGKESKPTTVSRKITPPGSSKSQKPVDIRIMQLSELEDKVIELNEQIVKSEKGRADLHESQQAVIRDLTKKINTLERMIASNRGMGGSEASAQSGGFRSTEPAGVETADNGETARGRTEGPIKVIRKKWNTRKPVEIRQAGNGRKSYYAGRGIDTRDHGGEPAEGSAPPHAFIQSYEYDDGAEAKNAYAPPMRYGVNEYAVKPSATDNTYQANLRQVYDDTRTDDAGINIYSSSTTNFGSW